MRSPYIVVIILAVSSVKVIYGTHQCGNCPPGFFVNGCKTNTTANCEQCPSDSYKLGTNSLTRCIRCTDCIGRNNIEVQKCNGTHDRTCRCRDDFWYDTGALFCSQCSSCRRGKGVVKECGGTSDTKCQRCVRGKTFSPSHSKTEPCLPCKICGKNEEEIAKCTRRKDTECRPIPEKKKFQLKNKSKWPDKEKDERTTAQSTTKIVEKTPAPTKRTITEVRRDDLTTSKSVSLEAKKQENSDTASTVEIVLYVIGACVGLIILVVIAVVVVRHRRKSTHPDKPRNRVSAPSEVSSPPRCKVIKEPVSVVSTTPLMEGYSEKLLRDVSYSLIDELSRNLNPKGRWKTLAGKLNFSSKDIENFGLEPTNATEVMLSHWGQQKGSTLHHLYEVLKSLKWLFEADLVFKYL